MKPSEKYQKGPDTPYKQEHYRYVLTQLLAIYGAIRNKYGSKNPVFLWDLYAGPGRTDGLDGEAGSPLIACELALKQSYPIKLHFYEANPSDAALLRENLSKPPYCNADFVVHEASNQSVLEILGRDRRHPSVYGLVYADPSNADLNGFDSIFAAFAIKYPRVDLLLNYAAASYKRKVKFKDYKSLQDRLNPIRKEKWFIREPIKQQQWTMLLGTNFNGLKPEEKKHWHDVGESVGKRLFLEVNYTAEQKGLLHNLGLFLTEQINETQPELFPTEKLARKFKLKCPGCSECHSKWTFRSDLLICGYCGNCIKITER